LTDAAGNVEEHIYRRRYRFLVVSAFSAFLGTLDASIVNVSLPTLSRTFSVSVDVVAWVVVGYALAVTATLLVVGRLAAQKGYRFVYVIGFVLFTIGSLFCAFAGSIRQLIAFRVIQGVGASFLMASGPALITRAFPVKERGRGIGILGTVVGVGLMTGPPLGGFLVTHVGWQSIFLINIPVGIFGIVYCARLLKVLKPDHPESKVDYTGGLLQAAGFASLMLFLNRMNSPGWPDFALYGILGVAAVAFGSFFRRELHTDHPLLGLSIFAHKQFTIAISVMMMTFLCTSALVVLIPFYMEEVLGFLPSRVGLLLMTVPMVTAVAAPLSGRIADAIGYRFLTTFGLIILFAGVIWMGTIDRNTGRWDIVLRLAVIGVGAGIFQAPNSTAMMSAVPRRIIGVASGLLAVARNIGITTGVAVSTAVFAYRRQTYAQTMDKADAFVGAFSWVVTAFAFIVLAAAVVSSTRKNRAPDLPEDDMQAIPGDRLR